MLCIVSTSSVAASLLTVKVQMMNCPPPPGPLCVQTLCSAVVQVYAADRSCSWVKRCCGVACLVKDNPLRSYFIRVFDIKVSLMEMINV